MPNSIQVSSSTPVDDKVAKFLVRFNKASYGPYSNTSFQVEEVVKPSGIEPGYASVIVPIKNFPDDIAPSVAFKMDGPLGAAGLRIRGEVVYFDPHNAGLTQPTLVGTLLRRTHINHLDAAKPLLLVDDKWVLTKFTVRGRLIYDPVKKIQWYDPTLSTIFDENNYPNCIDMPTSGGGTRPRFAPSYKYGWKENNLVIRQDLNVSNVEDTTQPDPGSATSQSRNFRVQDAIDYLQDLFTAGAYYTPQSKVEMGRQTLPDYIVWPDGISSFRNSDRPLHHVDVNGLPLGEVLQSLGHQAGAFDIEFEAIGGFKSQLKFVNMAPTLSDAAYMGSSLYLPEMAGSLESANSASNIISESNLTESIVNHFDNLCIGGESPSVESSCSTLPNDELQNQYEIGMEAAWDRGGGDYQFRFNTIAPFFSDEWMFLFYIRQHSPARFDENGDPSADTAAQKAAFDQACVIWPDVFAAYRIRYSWDIWKHTKWEGIAKNSWYPRIKPFQLTGYSNRGQPGAWQPRPIVTEVKLTTTDFYGNEYDQILQDDSLNNNLKTKWQPAVVYNQLDLSQDQTIVYTPSLRDCMGSARFQFNGGGTWITPSAEVQDPDGEHPEDVRMYGAAQTRPRDIRMNLALEADWPLTAFNNSDPNQTSAVIEPGTGPFTFNTVVGCGSGNYAHQKYSEYLRSRGSRPVGTTFLLSFNPANPIGPNWRYPPQAYPDQPELYTDRPGPADNPDPSGRMMTTARIRIQDINRIELNGYVEFNKLIPSYRPGMAVTIKGKRTFPAWGVIKCVYWNVNGQLTRIELNSAEPQIVRWNAGRVGNSYAPAVVSIGTNVPKKPEIPTGGGGDPYENPGGPNPGGKPGAGGPGQPGSTTYGSAGGDGFTYHDSITGKNEWIGSKSGGGYSSTPGTPARQTNAEKGKATGERGLGRAGARADKANEASRKAQEGYERAVAKYGAGSKNAQAAARNARRKAKRAENRQNLYNDKMNSRPTTSVNGRTDYHGMSGEMFGMKGFKGDGNPLTTGWASDTSGGWNNTKYHTNFYGGMGSMFGIKNYKGDAPLNTGIDGQEGDLQKVNFDTSGSDKRDRENYKSTSSPAISKDFTEKYNPESSPEAFNRAYKQWSKAHPNSEMPTKEEVINWWRNQSKDDVKSTDRPFRKFIKGGGPDSYKKGSSSGPAQNRKIDNGPQKPGESKADYNKRIHDYTEQMLRDMK